MNDLRKAAQMALEALIWHDETVRTRADSAAIIELRAALAQPETEQRPIVGTKSWAELDGTVVTQYLYAEDVLALAQPEPEPVRRVQKQFMDEEVFYTSPPQRKPLTDQEAKVLWADVYEPGHHLWIIAERFARAIEKAHGIGGEP